MSVNLQKGQKISLTKESTGLSKIIVGLGWDAATKSKKMFFSKPAVNIDCDAFAILLKDDKFVDASNIKKDLIYFGNLKHNSGSVEHLGDNLTGAGDGDDEQIIIELKKVPEEYNRIIIAANIYKSKLRNQHFGMIKNAYIHIMDGRNDEELCKYNLSDDYAEKTALLFGEIYRHNGEWKFNAVGQGTTDEGITEFVSKYR